MNNIVSLVSSGYGRLHFAQTAEWLSKAGVTIRLLCGWVPRNANSVLVRLCSKLIGRDLSPGMKKRMINLGNGGAILSCAWADFLCQSLFIFDAKVLRGKMHGRVAAFAWAVFGWQCKRYLKKVKGGKEVVFHVRSGGGHGGAIKCARKLHIPVVVDHSIAHPAYMEEHLREEYLKNGAQFDLGTSSPFWRLVVEDCEWADILLVNSYFVRDTFVEHGYDPEKIRVVYLGTRPDFFGLRTVRAVGREDRKLRLLFTGNFSFRKGAAYLLEAVRKVKESATVPFEMDVVGSYGEAKGIMQKYSQYNLPVHFHGPVPQDDLKRFLSSSDIYVFPSLAEGCACSGMEAMAAGLCVIGTREAGFPIEDGVNGCVVSGKDADVLASKILELMRNPERIDALGTAAADLIRNKYTWEAYADGVKNIYAELLNNEGSYK